MKCTYFIYDSIGMVGSQIAGGKERAILLWKKKFPNVAADAVGKLVAFDATSDKLPEGFIAERGKNPLVSGWSSDAIGKNIADAMRRGLPHAEAIAIALETARREYRKRHPTGPFPRQLKFIGKMRSARKNPAFRAYRYRGKKMAPKAADRAGDKNTQKRKIKAKKRGKNPVYSHIKVFKHGHGEKKFLKVGYFTGTGWDTDVKKAGQYSAGAARKLAEQLKIPAGWGLAIVSG